MKHERPAYDALLQVKTPKSFASALDRAADSHMMSRSDFIRAALVDRLRADGIDVDRLAGAALS
jgi:metal-responsive CopG/Arc/MetJ family transcriptional regulator